MKHLADARQADNGIVFVKMQSGRYQAYLDLDQVLDLEKQRNITSNLPSMKADALEQLVRDLSND